MKKWIFLAVLLVMAWLYGWRIYPHEILNYIPFLPGRSYKKPIIAQETRKNLMAHWRPQDLLDNFNGNRAFNQRQANR